MAEDLLIWHEIPQNIEQFFNLRKPVNLYLRPGGR